MSRVLTHNYNGYDRGCRCDVCREGAARRVREWRHRNRPEPCDVCNRVHPGRCAPTDERSKQIGVTLPGGVHQLLTERVPWGERSAFVAGLIVEALEETG